MDKQTILATGATGLIGSRFVEMFKDKYDVVNMDLTTRVDITNVETFTPFFDAHRDAKALIHLAAFTDTAKATLSPVTKAASATRSTSTAPKTSRSFAKSEVSTSSTSPLTLFLTVKKIRPIPRTTWSVPSTGMARPRLWRKR